MQPATSWSFRRKSWRRSTGASDAASPARGTCPGHGFLGFDSPSSAKILPQTFRADTTEVQAPVAWMRGPHVNSGRFVEM